MRIDEIANSVEYRMVEHIFSNSENQNLFSKIRKFWFSKLNKIL